MGKVNLNINHGEHSDIASDLLKKYLSERYSFGVSGIEVTLFKKFIKGLKSRVKSDEFTKLKLENSVQYYVETEDFFYIFSSYGTAGIYLELYTKSRNILEEELKFLNQFIKVEKEVVLARSSFHLSHRLQIKEDLLYKKDFKDLIPEYFPEIDVKEFFKQYFQSSEPLFILSGKSGTGKTKFLAYMLKYAIENTELLQDKNISEEEDTFISVAVVKNERILANDDFWMTLKDRDYDFVLLDDLDNFLAPREKKISSEIDLEKDKFISELLSFTDGIVKNKTKFIISTNQDLDAIDKALQRSGRLFEVFSFYELTSEQALAIWKKNKLKKKDFFKEFPGEYVLQADLGNKIEEYKKNDNKAAKPFLKEGSRIDVSHKFKHEKKAGFKV